MECDQAIERLPWLLNRTLTPEERQQVESHLGDCERCRQALAETRLAWEVFTQHVPTADLVAYAADEPTTVGRQTIDRHLAGCANCAAELEMARASRALAESEGVALLMPPAGSPRRGRFWQSSALAAGLVGVVAIGGWVHSAEEAARLGAGLRAAETAAAAHPAVSPASGATAGATGGAPAAAESGGELAAAIGINATILTLEAEGETTAVRSGDAAAPRQTVPPSAQRIVLQLRPSDSDNSAKRHAAELVDAAGKARELGDGLVLNPDGFYVVDLPRLLEPGEHTVRLYTAAGRKRTLVGSYSFWTAARSSAP